MTAMEYEEAPAVSVPRVRNWFSPALQAWARFLFGGYRRHYSLFEWFFFWWLIYFYWVCKLMLYVAVVALLLVAYLVWVPAELATYRHREKRAVLANWGPYMGELYGQDPPTAA